MLVYKFKRWYAAAAATHPDHRDIKRRRGLRVYIVDAQRRYLPRAHDDDALFDPATSPVYIYMSLGVHMRRTGACCLEAFFEGWFFFLRKLNTYDYLLEERIWYRDRKWKNPVTFGCLNRVSERERKRDWNMACWIMQEPIARDNLLFVERWIVIHSLLIKKVYIYNEDWKSVRNR